MVSVIYKGQGKGSESLGGGVISEKAQSRIVTGFPTAGELGVGGNSLKAQVTLARLFPAVPLPP